MNAARCRGQRHDHATSATNAVIGTSRGSGGLSRWLLRPGGGAGGASRVVAARQRDREGLAAGALHEGRSCNPMGAVL